MKEVWKNIAGYEGLYQVSNLGRVKSLDRYVNAPQAGGERFSKGRILKPHYNGKYYDICLCKGVKEQKSKSIHRLVMEAFVPNPHNLPQINHKDENKLNNFVWINDDGSVDPEKSNLEWCSAEYNLNYGTRLKRISAANETKIKIYEDEELIGIFSSVKLAASFFNYPRTRISSALSTGKKYKGFLWSYA